MLCVLYLVNTPACRSPIDSEAMHSYNLDITKTLVSPSTHTIAVEARSKLGWGTLQATMKGSTQDQGYAFVTYDGSKLSEDPNVRGLIRRRAMRHTAAIRKKTGGYGKHNVTQFPVLLLGPEEQNEDPESCATTLPYRTPHGYHGKDTPINQIAAKRMVLPDLGASWRITIDHPPASPFVSDISRNYYLLNLASRLTVLRLGVSTLSYLRLDNGCIGEILSRMPPYIKTRRVLSFIPSRYGHVSSITHATDCLIAGFSYIVQSGGKLSPTLDLATLRAYARALRSLQEAIDDEELRMTPETLCAAELLGLFEVCHSSNL